MTEKRVRKGMLVRRRLPALGLPIGPWLIVRRVERELIGAEVVNISNLLSETGEFRCLLKNNVYIPTRAVLNVSPSVVKTIAMCSQVIVRHPATTNWLKVYRDKPELITFFSDSDNKVIVKPWGITHQRNGRETEIIIYVDHVVTQVIR